MLPLYFCCYWSDAIQLLICPSWDDWVPHDRLRKFTEENKELAQDLKREMDDSRARAAPKSASTKKKTAGSDFSSARGSEERHSSLPVTGRGSKRGRDMEIEKVGGFYFFYDSSPCPDLESDTSDSGRSGAFDHAITPEVEPEPLFACYDGTGDPPARRSERKPKPRAVFEQNPVPAPQPKRRKKAATAATSAVGDGTLEDLAAATKSTPNAKKVVSSASAVQPAQRKAGSTSHNNNETTTAIAHALIKKEHGPTVSDPTVVEEITVSPIITNAKDMDEPLKAGMVAGEAPTASDDAPTQTDVAPEEAGGTTATAALPGASHYNSSSSSLSPPPVSTDESNTPAPTTAARKPTVKSNVKGKEKNPPRKSSTRSAASYKQNPTAETLNNVSTPDPPKSAAKGKGKALSADSSNTSSDPVEPQTGSEITKTGLSVHSSKAAGKGKAKPAKGKGKALPVDSGNTSLDPVVSEKSLEVTENGLTAEMSKPAAKSTVNCKGKASLPEATSNALDNDSPPGPKKPKMQSKAKGAKGKNKASIPVASDALAPLETSNTSEENNPTPDAPKTKSQGKGAKAKGKASPPESASSFAPRTTLEVLQNDPPKSAKNSKKPPKPIYVKAQTRANYVAEQVALLGEPYRISDTYLPESNRYRHHEDKQFFYAGIPADMDKKPRKFMGIAKVSKQRAAWMRFRKIQRRAGLSRVEINHKWESILAEAEKARLHLDATSTNGNDKDSSTLQGSDAAATTTADQGSLSSSSSRSAVVDGDDHLDRGTLDKPWQSKGEDTSVTATETNPDHPESSTAQNSQESSSSGNASKKRKSVTFAADVVVHDPVKDSTPEDSTAEAHHREESPPKRARHNKTSKVNLRSYRALQEESFLSRAAVRIPVSDHLKALLVDDWEEVTKNLSLVPLPSEHPVTEILANYLEEEKAKRRVGSAEYDLLEEVVAGVKEYFNRCLGRILLYRFEREQYFEISKLWDEGREGWEGKGASDAYGAEHLTRLFGKFFLGPFSLFYLSLLHKTELDQEKKKGKEKKEKVKTNEQNHSLNNAKKKKQFPSPNSSPRPTWTPSPSPASARNSPR